MRFFRFSILPLCMAMLLASCEGKEEKGGGSGGEGEDLEPVTFTVSSSIETRTVLGDKQDGVYRVFWCDGDRICVNGIKSGALHGIPDSTVNASFTVAGVTPPFNIVYPSIGCESMTAEGLASISIPMAQKYVPGSFANGSAILYGHSEGTDVKLNNLCGLVKIPVYAARATKIKSVELISKSLDDPLAGEFTLDTRSGALTPVEGSSILLLSFPAEGVQLSTTDTLALYIAAHVGAYPAGFNIRFTDTQDRTMIAEWTESTAIEAGVIAGLPAVEFDPSTALEITDIETWELFAAAANAGDWSEWANKNGEVNLLGNISVAGGITAIKEWDGVFKGNGFTISRGNAANPIFETIKEGAVVKDLVIGGKVEELPDGDHEYVVYDVNYAKFVCPLSLLNQGTISNCTSKVEISLNNMNTIFYLGGMVMYNAGVMEGCSNEGPITVRYQVDNRRWGTIGGLACFASNGAASHPVSPANYRDIESAGTFINCSNKADILVSKKSNSTTGGTHYLAGFDLGGICASVNAGTREHPALFDGCTNSGNITFLEYEIGSTTQYDYAMGVGGIVGCIGNHTPLLKIGGSTVTTAWYEIPTDYSSQDATPAGYACNIKNCSNTGALEMASRSGNNKASTITATGVPNQRKQAYLGGIVAYCYALPERPDTILNCSNTGSMRYSERYIGSGGGGIAGAVANVLLKDCTVNIGEDKKIAPSVQPQWYVPATAGSNYRGAGFFGGLFGICHSNVSVDACKCFIYADYALTPAASGGDTSSYIRYPGLFFGIVVPGATASISGDCKLGGHLMTYFYNPGKTNLDKKFLLKDLDRDNYTTFICYRDVYDNWYKDMWVEAGHTASLLVAVTDTNYGTVTGKENVSYWDGK